MIRRHNHSAAAVVAGSVLALAGCVSLPDEAAPTDNRACELLRPVAGELGLGEPRVSTIDERERCTASSRESDNRKYVTFSVSLEGRPLTESVTGQGKRTDLTLGGHDAVMVLGDINSGECQVFLDPGDGTSVVLRLTRNNAMTQQTCAELEPIADRVAGRLGTVVDAR